MGSNTEAMPVGAGSVPGLRHRHSPMPVSETVERLTAVIEAAGARVFAIIDHSGEAERVGQSLRETKLVIFGNPAAGTPAMVTAPLLAIDLPVKVLVWADDDGVTWMSYLDASWLAERHGLPADEAAPLEAPDRVTARVVG
jgi:uncharacterized protein (DUF302 family)